MTTELARKYEALNKPLYSSHLNDFSIPPESSAICSFLAIRVTQRVTEICHQSRNVFSSSVIRGFLKTYGPAQDLDHCDFDRCFPPSLRRSDFLLYSREVVCEVKEFQDLNVPARVERLHAKRPFTQPAFKRAMYSTISNALREAGQQIRDTKHALSLTDALGLVILDNSIPRHLSFMTLLDAAERKMLTGLTDVDAVLCIDDVNAFLDPDGKPIKGAQTVSRGTIRSQRLSELVLQLMTDYSAHQGVPFFPDRTLARGDQRWIVDAHGRYQRYHATFEFQG